MTKPKEIVRAEQLLALAAYNPEGEEARTAAMALVKQIISKGLILVMDGYKQERPRKSTVHQPPPPSPPPPPAPVAREPSPRARKVKHTPPAAAEPEQPKRRAPRSKPKPSSAPPPIDKRDEPNPDQMDLFPRKFVARSGGTCIHCRKPFKENDHIFWMAGAGATHDWCSTEYKWPIRTREKSS